MNPDSILNLSGRALRVFRVFGQLEFIKRLHDFLIHEGKRSRAETLEQTAKVLLILEQAESLRIKNGKAMLDLMVKAGFPEEKIQATLNNPQEMQRINVALTKLLHYVDKGVVTVKLVQAHDKNDDVVSISIE
jgi:hypothetical protein